MKSRCILYCACLAFTAAVIISPSPNEAARDARSWPSFVRTQATDGWRGIVPLRSTRAEVEGLIGSPDQGRDEYDLEDGRVSIIYSQEPCAGGPRGAYNVPRDTVIGIDVEPQRRLKLSDLGLDLGKYKKTRDPMIEAHTSYSNEVEGVSIRTSGSGDEGARVVLRIFYGPRAGDVYLRCPSPPERDQAGNGPGAEQEEDDAGPLGECPTISIALSGGASAPGEYSLSASITGAAASFEPTYKWAISAGHIVSGQGTITVKIDTGGAGCDPVTVRLEVGGVIPRGCSGVKTYTIEQSKPR